MAFTPYKFFALCAIFILICGFTATKTESIENLESECRPYVEKALKDQLQKGDPALQPSDSAESQEAGGDSAETTTETDDKSQEDGQPEEKAASSENVSGGDEAQVETGGSAEVEGESQNLETASEDVSTEKSSDINLIQPEDEIASESEEQTTDAQQSTEINEDDVQADQAPEPESTEEQNVEDKTLEEAQSVEVKEDGETEPPESTEASKEATDDAASAESAQQQDEPSEATEEKESAEQKDESAEQKDESAEQKDESAEQKDGSAEQKEESAEQKDESAEQKEESAEQKEESAEQKDESTEQKDESTEQKDESAEQKDESAEPKEESAEQKEESSEQKEESAEQKEESAEPKDESTEQKDESAEQKDESVEQKDESAEQKEDSADSGESKLDEKPDSGESAVESAEKQSEDSKEAEGSVEETKDAESAEKTSDDSGEAQDKKDQSTEGDTKEASDKHDETEEKKSEEAKSDEEKAAESDEASAEQIDELAGETNATETSVEETDEDELTKEFVIPEVRRPRDQLIELLHLDEESTVNELALAKAADTTLRELKRLYDSAIKPLEILYKYRDLSNRHFGDPEIFSKPLILFMGPWSGGKSSIINYLLDNEYNENSLRTGAEPSPAYFNIVTWGPEPEILDGTQLAADWTFSGLQKFGQGLEDRLRGLKLPNKLLEKVNIVEIPGILEVRKQVSRVFPFNDACQWFIDRADIIFLVYDPSKLDVGPETEAILDQLKGREYQTRVILNKADTVKPEELLRVQGALLWNISPLMSSAQPPIIYTTSLWSTPFNPGSPVKLLQAQERAFLRDIRQAIDKRVENKIASARRFAVRVRNHAKMVDCYLTTYYNHKTFFGNRKQIADDIIENPQQYHIYEGLSTLKNISRYDLPDPDSYKDFFRLNALYDFQQLSATCTYFKGCPINRLDVCIAYDLPELVGKHKKLVEQSLGKTQLNS
ncbi:nipped-B-like protein [Chrysoperla carnea]|uniref:nipped-B-like protein n=1 Tax=Chrysoperla carnea TaxID=189513 RepID=UPI001D061F5C|nr:nipped-B-like protein [Chrysoperla carnea]